MHMNVLQRHSTRAVRVPRHGVPLRSRHVHPQAPLRPAAGGFFGDLKEMLGGGADKQQAAEAFAPTVFPPYTVVKKGAAYDLRLYEVYPVVQVQYQRRDEGYTALGSYFDGQNASGTRFQETQPVVMRYEPQGRKTMQLYVGPRSGAPASEPAPTLTQLPAPSSREVALGVGGGEVVAVFKFEGYITPASAEAARQALLAALQADGMQVAEEEAAGLFRVAQYGPLYSLSTRVNEMMLRVKL